MKSVAPSRISARVLAGSIAVLVALAPVARATSGIWLDTGNTNGQWSTTSNWVSGAVPGATSGTTNTDTATFNTALGTFGTSGSPIVIDANRNISSISFDTAAGNYYIGTAGGNSLLLTAAGAIQILNTLTAVNAVETINAPLVIEGASGTYTLANNSANGTGAGAGTLDFGGGITGGAAGNTVLTLTGSNTNANTISGVIANGTATSVALTKSGLGTWVLSGANTYTGATTLNGGTLALSFGSVSANILSTASALTLGNGTLSLTGTGTQTVNGLTTTASTDTNILLGSNETLTLGALISVGSGSALNFNTIAGGANATTSTVGTGVIVLTGQTAGNAINPGFTVSDTGGFGLATVNASNDVVRLTTTTLLPASGATSATNYLINNNASGTSAAGSSSLAVSASESAKSLTVDTTAASGVVTLNSGVVLSNNTWNFGGNGSNTWQITGSASGAGLKAATSGANINFNNYNSGTVTLNSPILANGSNAVSVYGTGTLIFAAANTYSGNTIVSGGTLQVATGGSINTNPGFLYVGYNSGDNGTLNITGGNVTSQNGYLGYSPGSSGTATISSGTLTSGSLQIGSGGAGVLNVTGGSVSTSSTYIGAFSGATGVLNVTGGSIVSSFDIATSQGSSGTVTVSGGTLAGYCTVGDSGNGVLNVIGSGSVSLVGSLTLGQGGGNGTLNIGTGGIAGTLQVGVVNVGAGTAVVNFNHTGSFAFAPQISGATSIGLNGGILSVNQLGTGTTILTAANTYTGATTISAGQLIAANSFALNPFDGAPVTVSAGAGLGYAAVADAPLVLGFGSTLAITGGAGTVLGGSIGSTAASAEINVTGAATISNGAHAVNVYGISGVAPLAGTNTYTLLQGGPGSSLNPTTAPLLGTVYNNTNFTVGTFTATASTLQIVVSSATPITSAYWVGGLSGASNVWSASNGSTASNWGTTAGGAVQALIPGAGATVTISATSPVTAPVATVLGANMSIAGLTIANTVNGLGLNADGFALTVGAGGITMNASVPASTIAANVVLGSSQTWTNNSANPLTVSGVVSGNNSLTKAGAGTLILSGANTYAGATTINAGTLQLGNGIAIGNNSAVTLANVAGTTLNVAGFSTQIGSLTGGGSLGGNISLGTAALTVGGDNTSPAAYAGVLSGTGGALTKIGTGTLTLSGANTYTGATTLNGGTLALSFGSVSANILPSASALTLGSGTLSLTGTGTQIVNGLTTTASSGNKILLGANETLTLGALTSVGANSEVNFNTATGGANATTSTIGTGIIVLSGQTAGNAINSSFTVTDAGGFGLATVSASNQLIRLTTTTLLPASGASSATNYRINNNAGGSSAAGSSNLAITTSEAANSISVDTTAAAGIVTLNSGVVLSNNTWNFGGTGANTWQITGSASGAGLKPVASGNAINFNNNASGAITLGSPILANGTNAVSLYGTGTLIFAGANTYTGNTTVSSGTLQVATGGSINSSSAYVTIGNKSGDNGTLNITGGSVSDTNGYLGSSGASGGTAPSSGTATVSSGSWTSSNGLFVGLDGTGVLNIAGGSVSSSTADLADGASASGMATVSGGTWTNSGAFYIGNSGAGVLKVTGGSVSSPNGYLGYNAGSSGALTVSSGSWTNGGSIYVGYSGTGALNITGGNVSSSSSTIGYFAGSSGTASVSSGSWTNSTNALYIGYFGTGVLNITGGSVSSPSSALGYFAGSSGTASVNGGTWTNSGNLEIGGAGTGVLNISGGGMVSVGATGTATLAQIAGSTGTLNLGTGGTVGIFTAGTVTGGSGTAVVNFNETGNYAFSPQLMGSLSVNKLGAGTTVLSGINTYTGSTTVSAGQLIAANSSALSPAGGAVTVAAGAGLAYDALADAPLALSSTLAITGGAGTVIGGSIGSTPTSAEINVAGAATATGAVQVNIFGGGVTPLAGTNTYTLLTGGTGSALNGATYSLGPLLYNDTGFTVGALSSTATTLQVVITSTTTLASAYWTGGFGGAPNVWSISNGTTASNWTTTAGGAVQALVPGSGTNVIFSSTTPVTAPTATVLGSNMSIGGLTIADTVNGLGLNADGFTLTVGAGGITMNAGVPASSIAATVILGANQTWTNNSHNPLTVSGVVSGGNSLTIAGTGTLTLSGANTFTGATAINAGATLQVGGAGSLGNAASISNNGTLEYSSTTAQNFAGVISGTGALEKDTSSSVLTLSGANTYTGETIVSAGTLAAGAGGAFGNNSAVILANVAGATLNLAGFNTQIGSLTGGGLQGGSVTLGAATLTVGGDNTSPAAYAGSISGTGGLTKIGTGTLTLSDVNFYTGATTVSGGTLNLAFGNVFLNMLNTNSALTLAGGTLALTGAAAQTLKGLTTATNTGSEILLGSNETLTLGALTSAGANSALNFNTIAGGANATTSTVGTGVLVLTGQTAGNPINTGFTVSDTGGFGLATVNASNQVVRLTSTALLPAATATSATNYLVNNNAGGASSAGSSSLTVTASESANSITVDTTAAAGIVTLNSGVVLSNNTWNFGGNGSNTWQITGAAAGAGLKSVTSGGTININNVNSSAVTISTPILANGTNAVNVYGTGTLIFAGANTYTGATTVSSGTLAINGSIASSSGVSVAQGAILSGHGSVSVISGAGLVTPGDPEILTATQVDPSGGLSFAFSFTQAGSPTYTNASASGNDVVHLTGATPFVFTLTAANIVTVDFSGATLLPGQTYLGGFFTDTPVADAEVNQATFDYTGTNGAVVQYEGLVTEPSAAFAMGTVTNGKVMEFQVTPEPGSIASLMLGAGSLLGWRPRRRTSFA